MTSPLLLFDIDGTLTDTSSVDSDCFFAACSEVLERPMAPRDWALLPEVTDAGVLVALWLEVHGRGPTLAETAQVQQHFFAKLRAELGRRPERFGAVGGAAALLTRLVDENYPHAIATGAWRESACIKLAAAGLATAALRASSDDSPVRAEIFARAEQRCTGRAHQGVVLVGDGTWDLQVSRTLGWSFVGVGQGAQAERLRSAGASRVVPDLTQLDVATLVS